MKCLFTRFAVIELLQLHVSGGEDLSSKLVETKVVSLNWVPCSGISGAEVVSSSLSRPLMRAYIVHCGRQFYISYNEEHREGNILTRAESDCGHIDRQ